MLNVDRADDRSNNLIARTLIDNPELNPMALGCAACTLKETCGGLCVKANIMDCLDLCCGTPDQCTRVCRNREDAYVDQVREIGDFLLRNGPRTPILPIKLTDEIIPLIFHGSSRRTMLSSGVFALRLTDLVNFATGQFRFNSRAEMCANFHINPGADIILTGVNQDHRIEAWWSLHEKRIPIIRDMVAMNIKLVTTPNFSLILDHPRHDDMHAMKRIGILFAEFQENGMPCALHPNSRTEMDFTRWGRFIAEREEVQVISYEFITGSARKDRRAFHLDQLSKLASKAGRDLDIIVRGDPSVIPELRRSFRKVIYIETTSFLKSIKRQRAERKQNNALHWVPAPTENGESIAPLLEHNLKERTLLLKALYFGPQDQLRHAA